MKRSLILILIFNFFILIPSSCAGGSSELSTKQMAAGLSRFCKIHSDEYDSRQECFDNQIVYSTIFVKRYLKPTMKKAKKYKGKTKIKDLPIDIQIVFIAMEASRTDDDRWPYDFKKLVILIILQMKDVANHSV